MVKHIRTEAIWDALYDRLSKEITQIETQEPCLLTQSEACFHLTRQYYSEIRAILPDHRFPGMEEETRFFKFHLPRFSCLLEYYSLAVHALMFRPEEESEKERYLFRERQIQKLDRFRKRYEDITSYYTNGRTDMDARYFCRAANEPDSATVSPVDGPVLPTRIIGMLLGLEKYQRFCLTHL